MESINYYKGRYELLDARTHTFSPATSQFIFDLVVKTKTCKFCGSDLISHMAKYYKHPSGWQTIRFWDKIWIWFECSKCRHGWGINHLGVPRDLVIPI